MKVFPRGRANGQELILGFSLLKPAQLTFLDGGPPQGDEGLFTKPIEMHIQDYLYFDYGGYNETSV